MNQIRSMIATFIVFPAVVMSLLTTTTRPVSAGEAGERFASGDRIGCSKHLEHRSPQQVIEQHMASLAADDIPRAMCDYAEDAQVILPGGQPPAVGLDVIQAGLEFFVHGVFEDTQPVNQPLSISDEVVFYTFSVVGPHCSVPDGADTYIIRRGQIVKQTAHDTIRTTPGQSCAYAAPGF